MRRAVFALLVCAPAPFMAGIAAAQETPRLLPARDVDITYRLAQTGRDGAEQRLRWDTARGLLRVDPPSPGLYAVLDTHARHMSTVRDSDRVVVEADGVGAPVGVDVAGGRFVRGGTQTVAGLTCTDWQTRDASGQDATICMTEDGVMLRAVQSGRVMLEAVHVHYGTQDPGVFALPAGYRHVTVPPAAR